MEKTINFAVMSSSPLIAACSSADSSFPRHEGRSRLFSRAECYECARYGAGHPIVCSLAVSDDFMKTSSA